jgi:hypothetical protein
MVQRLPHEDTRKTVLDQSRERSNAPPAPLRRRGFLFLGLLTIDLLYPPTGGQT